MLPFFSVQQASCLQRYKLVFCVDQKCMSRPNPSDLAFVDVLADPSTETIKCYNDQWCWGCLLKTRLPTTLSGCCWLYCVMSDLTLKHTHGQLYSHSAATKAKNPISIITARAVIHSKSRETKLVICKEMFLTLEPVNIILLTAPHILKSSNEVASIKAYNPHFPPELLNGRPTAVFALGHECVLLDVKQCCKRILMCLSKPWPAK